MPTVDWFTPNDWLTREKVTADDFNEQIKSNIQWLFEKNILVIQRAGITDLTTTNTVAPSTTPVASYIINTIFFDKDDQDSSIRFHFDGNVFNTSAANETYFDIIVDQTYFLSTGTATPLTKGMAYVTTQLPSRPLLASFARYLEGVTAGTRRFDLVWWCSGGTSTLNYTNTMVQFSVEEYGIPNYQ